MSSPQLPSIGLVMPRSFNSEAHNNVHECLAPYKGTHFGEWMSFGIAWKGVAYRYKGALTYHQRFTQLIKVTKSPVPEDRFEQEHVLFGFFSAALSSIECYYYALYCIAAMKNSVAFPAASPKDLRIYPVNVKDKFLAVFPNELVTAGMQSAISDPIYAEIGDIRNVLTHRGSPPRQFFQGGSHHGKAMSPSNLKDPASQWVYAFEIDGKTTASKWQWVDGRLHSLLENADKFCRAHMGVKTAT